MDWVHARSTEIMESIGDAAARATPAEAARIKQALFDTWSLYFAPEGHGQTPESVFRQLTSPVQRGRLVARGTFLAEFTRQLHQAGVTGQTTETAGLLGRLKAWVQQALDGLKQAYSMARGGAMGQPLRDLMDRAEAVLQGRESALPIQPGLHLPSGPGDAFLAANTSDSSHNESIKKQSVNLDPHPILKDHYLHGQSAYSQALSYFGNPTLLLRGAADSLQSSGRDDSGTSPQATRDFSRISSAGGTEAERLGRFANEFGLMLNARGVREDMLRHKLEGGMEHRVAYMPGTARVVKDLDCNVTLTSSLWNYLTDFEIGNVAWGDDVIIEGFYLHEGSLHIVTSQPFVAGVHPERNVLREKVVNQFPIVDKAPYDPVVGDYYLATEELGDIQIMDLHPGNVIEGPDGRLSFIDVHFRFKTPQERQKAIRLIRGLGQ